ncbi:hypothetical protein M8845_18495 [Gelidibacter japonicus]|uniref:hypothetical protein n=1 Tax=Gelidibacter japonicus TaxID=1962232 RepID=UPI002020B915|nr:hypothetical protein [Gelidibacter japonicus]MCL8009421.1 hypothetical protein [Gelidibacter japonicus]
MDKNLKKVIQIFILLILPIGLFAQKDVTQFLDIPVDGYKPEMIEKLKSRGFTINRESEDILNGEFNGTKVNVLIGTNNNKVWRIAVFDEYPTDETNIKIRFNNLIQQFANNERYSTEADSTIAKYSIPKDEDISYEIAIHKKRYEAVFYQKSIKHDSLSKELKRKKDLLTQKDSLNNEEFEILKPLMVELGVEIMNSINKQVWFMIKEDYGEYRIVIFYENEYNKANGSKL